MPTIEAPPSTAVDEQPGGAVAMKAVEGEHQERTKLPHPRGADWLNKAALLVLMYELVTRVPKLLELARCSVLRAARNNEVAQGGHRSRGWSRIPGLLPPLPTEVKARFEAKYDPEDDLHEQIQNFRKRQAA